MKYEQRQELEDEIKEKNSQEQVGPKPEDILPRLDPRQIAKKSQNAGRHDPYQAQDEQPTAQGGHDSFERGLFGMLLEVERDGSPFFHASSDRIS